MSSTSFARKIGTAIVGFGVLFIGIVLLALPGPGIALIIVALLILAREFAWARRYADLLKRKAKQAAATAKKHTTQR